MEFILEIGQDKDGKRALKWVGRGDKMIIDMSRELFCILFFVISVIGYIFYKKRNAKIHYWIIPVFIIFIKGDSVSDIYIWSGNIRKGQRRSRKLSGFLSIKAVCFYCKLFQRGSNDTVDR